MPIIRMFNGILVRMYAFDDSRYHHPHIQIRYNEHKAVVRIHDGKVLEENLPGKQMKLLQAWIALHQDESMADWQIAAEGVTLSKLNLYARLI